jgi:hypothetical protein
MKFEVVLAERKNGVFEYTEEVWEFDSREEAEWVIMINSRLAGADIVYLYELKE